MSAAVSLPLEKFFLPSIEDQDVQPQIDAIRLEMVAAEERYAGGLAAEKQAVAVLVSEWQNKLRLFADVQRVQRVLRSLPFKPGRRIDLASILEESRPDGNPRWALVDPMMPIGKSQGSVWGGDRCNGGYFSDGDVCVGRVRFQVGGREHRFRLPVNSMYSPAGGFPALPKEVRQLATDDTVRENASWVGVLYQPEEWREVDLDPALVVEWKALPVQYYALAVWGHDGPHIMEFVQ